MTRINSAIPPKHLCDQHLLAEYRELPRISTLAWKRYHSAGKKLPERGPEKFTLGNGHMTFFTYLGKFCQERFNQIVAEMQRRGFKPNYPTYRLHPEGMNEDHTPTAEERQLLSERIVQRMPKDPRWTNCQQYVVFRNDKPQFSGDEQQVACYLYRNEYRIGEYTVHSQEDANDRSEPLSGAEWLQELEDAIGLNRETPQCLKDL